MVYPIQVHSEHDSKFYQLMRQVERECDELDWTHSSGSSVGGGSAILPDEETSTPGVFHAQRLGGGGDRSRSRLLGEMQQPPAQTPARQLPIINGEFEDRDRLPRPVLSNESSIDDQAARPSQRPESSAPALASASEPAPTLTPVREQVRWHTCTSAVEASFHADELCVGCTSRLLAQS